MKRWLSGLLVALLLTAHGCAAQGGTSDGAGAAPLPDDTAVMSATIVSAEQDSLLLAGAGEYEGVYWVGTKGSRRTLRPSAPAGR